jgi:hypothetical protein
MFRIGRIFAIGKNLSYRRRPVPKFCRPTMLQENWAPVRRVARGFSPLRRIIWIRELFICVEQALARIAGNLWPANGASARVSLFR